MELVAASKLRRAQERMQNARPYADELTGVMAQLMSRSSGGDHPFLAVRPVSHRCLVLVTSDRGLVGGLNSFWGPSVGVLILLVVPEFFFRNLQGDLPYATAAILLIIAFLLPDGVVGLVKLLKERVRSRLGKSEVRADARD